MARVVEMISFPESRGIPNNPTLPVIIYRQALASFTDCAAAFEHRFRENDWTGSWRNGVFSYQHYHSQAHEVLGIAGGKAQLLIGGPDGRTIDVTTGDCLVLPAGTGHCRIRADRDFLVIGAYPPGQTADIVEGPADHFHRAAIRTVPLPLTDPIDGRHGPLIAAWHGK